jgi:hypothetical protein
MEWEQLMARAQRLSYKVSTLLLGLFIFVNLFLTSCASSKPSGTTERRVAEAEPVASASASPAATATTAEPAVEESLELPPPKPEEVREAVKRVYKDAVTIDTSRPSAYVVGDFNGDGSQDIAVVVRPAKDKLEEINDEVANWIVEDPRQVALPDPHKSVQTLAPNSRPVVKPNDLLLAVIHGYKKEGWRNREAQQTYLLDNAVGNSLAPTPLKDLRRALGNQDRAGDAIKETLAGEEGFLYWTGAKYAWHKKQ